jgi:DNA-binding beta-propeller fold protein YncE
VADRNNHRIRLIFPQGQVSTLAGGRSGHRDGEGTVAQFRYPTGVAVDGDGNAIVADRGNGRIRRVASDVVIPRRVEFPNHGVNWRTWKQVGMTFR